MKLKNRIRWEIRKLLIDYNPKMLIDYEWRRKYGYNVDWENPRDINEKIQWLICYSEDTTEWTRLADKYRVRGFIKEKGYENLLVPIHGVWKNPEEIDFDSLPDKFVLKCNHDSASTKIIDKNQGFNRDELIDFYKKRLKVKYGYLGCEPHYNKISPLVIAEEFLKEDNGFCSINDYKFWCFDGKAYYVSVLFDRSADLVRETVYDLSWNAHPEFLESYGNYKSEDRILPKPHNLDEMISIAEDLSKGFPEVRVDLYDVNGKIYFGEMTFAPTAGKMGYVDSFLKELGDKVVLPPKK